MHSAVLVLIWLLQPTAAQGGHGAARPAECRVVDGVHATNAWERAKEPNLRRYCDLLASGTAKLVGVSALVKEVPQIADEADALLPDRASPHVLKGRALLRLGQAEAALASLREAKQRDDRALDDPIALLAWARANARTGHLAEAAQAYRAALPRTAALPAQERASALFEAGMTVMAQGATELDDAVAMLRQARRDTQDAMQVAAVAALALALDRAGLREESRAVLASLGRADVASLLDDPRVVTAMADAGVMSERDALVAIALDRAGGATAKDAWRTYLDGGGGKGVWAEHAREHAAGVASKRQETAAPRPSSKAEKANGGGAR